MQNEYRTPDNTGAPAATGASGVTGEQQVPLNSAGWPCTQSAGAPALAGGQKSASVLTLTGKCSLQIRNGPFYRFSLDKTVALKSKIYRFGKTLSALYSNPTPRLTLIAMSMHSRCTASFDRSGKSEKLPLTNLRDSEINPDVTWAKKRLQRKERTRTSLTAYGTQKKWTALIGFCKRDTIT